MAKWKLTRQTYGTDEYDFCEGDEITIGRGANNSITLSSLVISRQHCVLKFFKDKITIRDLKSSNGTYVGTDKIPPNTPVAVQDAQCLGIGWMEGAALAKISDTEKFIFKINREKSEKSIIDRIAFQNEIDSDEIEEKLAVVLHDVKPRLSNIEDTAMQKKTKNQSPNLNLKRKSIEMNVKDESYQVDSDSSNSKHAADVVNLLSDSDTELPSRKNEDAAAKRVKLEPIVEEKLEPCIKEEPIKIEIDDDEYEAGIIKRELFDYDDEPINLDSDSDSDTERRWFIRLSQSSPGKPLTKAMRRDVVDGPVRESSYSQIIEDDYEPVLPSNENVVEDEEFMDDLISIPVMPTDTEPEEGADQVDGYSNTGLTSDYFAKQLEKEADKRLPPEVPTAEVVAESSLVKKTQMIEALAQTSRRKSTVESKPKEKSSSSKHSKSSSKHSNSHSKRHMSSSQKEERKKKLKEIASKEKEVRDKSSIGSSSSSKVTVGAKVSSSSRGAFLAEGTATVQPTTRKDSPKSHKSHHKDSDKKHDKSKTDDAVNNIENRNKHKEKPHSSSSKSKSKLEKKDKHRKSSKSDTDSISEQKLTPKKSETRVPLKNLKPLTDSDDTYSGRPVSKVEPFPTKKPKKTVRFSDAPPQIKVFEIEPGNQMKKTSLVKSTIDVPQKPAFSLEKITLMRILRWNPQWLSEQINNNEPPPILGHSVPPMAVLHFFQAHTQYCQVIGDLLLMEIWESVTQTFIKKRGCEFTLRIESIPPVPAPEACFDIFSLSVNARFCWIVFKRDPSATSRQPTNNFRVIGDLLLMEIWESVTQTFIKKRGCEFTLRIESIPPVPAPEACFDIFSLSVNVSVPKNEMKNLPRMGELMLVTFGPETSRSSRFFYVNHVRCLPSPPNNIYSFFSISLHGVYTDKMRLLRRGEVMVGRSLSYIKNVLQLFEAMEYLSKSPLCDAILRPEPRHFPRERIVPPSQIKSPWTATLNSSQLEAVSASVSAALGDRPAVQMIQGPPGTGKSSVICSIIMTYFYDGGGRRLQNRGKILICATSNAAVDELVIRLLNIRQSLPKTERFRMVRVGRPEAMHPKARDLSSQCLAQRDAQRTQEPMQPSISEEVARLEAKLNMWRSQAQEAKEAGRRAFCHSQSEQIRIRIAQLKGNSPGGDISAEQLAMAERRIVECADIIVSTLSSAANQKMKGLRRRIALCIVDEAGQAIEPDTLVPLSLDVTRLTLIGDPRQLPGFIKSQRAKQHGLGESLFSRLSSSMEHWNDGSPVVLLNVQYRMHPAIADYPNRTFYEGKICNEAKLRTDHPLPAYAVVHISSGDKGQGASGANEMEAWGVSRLVSSLSKLVRSLHMNIAVITPYEAQREAIRNCLRTLEEPNSTPVEVNTVDSFQGQERDVVVVSLARSKGVGFLSDAGRMNVMLTRAKHSLLICLNPNAMSNNQQWRTLLDDAQQRSLFKYLPNKVCQPATAGQCSDSILKYITTR